MGWKSQYGLASFSQTGKMLPTALSKRSLFLEAFHTQEFLVFGRANLKPDFFSIARASNVIQLRTA
jgi:hypothetical protein